MIYQILVKPGSHQDEIIVSEDSDTAQDSALDAAPDPTPDSATNSTPDIIVKTRKKAHDGEANAAVIDILAKHFHVGKTSVIILKGANSRHKTVEIK